MRKQKNTRKPWEKNLHGYARKAKEPGPRKDDAPMGRRRPLQSLQVNMKKYNITGWTLFKFIDVQRWVFEYSKKQKDGALLSDQSTLSRQGQEDEDSEEEDSDTPDHDIFSHTNVVGYVHTTLVN